MSHSKQSTNRKRYREATKKKINGIKIGTKGNTESITNSKRKTRNCVEYSAGKWINVKAKTICYANQTFVFFNDDKQFSCVPSTVS